MTRADFLRRLARGLRTLPAADREAILADYERYFADGAEASREESEVAASLGKPARLAAELRLAYDVNAWRSAGGTQSIWRATRGLLALSLLEGLLWLPALLAVLLLILGMGAGIISALYGAFTLIVAPFDQPLGGASAALLRGIALLAAGATLLLVANAGVYGLSSLLVRSRGDRRHSPSVTEVSS